MNRRTSITVQTVRFPGRGSDYFGACEVCGKHMAEAAVFERHWLYVDGDGDLYLSGTSAGTYAHVGCKLNSDGAKVVSKDTLPRKGNLRLWPRVLLSDDLVAAGVSARDAAQFVEAVAGVPA